MEDVDCSSWEQDCWYLAHMNMRGERNERYCDCSFGKHLLLQRDMIAIVFLQTDNRTRRMILNPVCDCFCT